MKGHCDDRGGYYQETLLGRVRHPINPNELEMVISWYPMQEVDYTIFKREPAASEGNI